MNLSKQQRHDLESAIARLRILAGLYADSFRDKREVAESAEDALDLLEDHLVQNCSLREKQIPGGGK